MAAPNIVWITLDSVRADHTSMDGYERDTTPRLKQLGSESHTFTECFAHSKATLQSSGSLLTGYAPSRNTLGIDGNILPDTVPTIAERFKDLGYDTACLSRNSFVSSETGLDRGFDRFQWLSSSTLHQLGLKTILGYLCNIREHSAGLTLEASKHSTPFLMNTIAKKWLKDFSTQEPFFFYLHYNEPHRPYYPPLSYIDQFTEDIAMTGHEAAEFSLNLHYNLKKQIANGIDLTDDEWDALHAMYDAEIAYTDEMIGQLIDHINSLPLENTVVVVTADHGELFGEYGLLSHKYVLHDGVTRVPMVVNGLDDELVLDSDDLVQHADVMATLLSKAGGDIEDLVGVDLMSEMREFAVSQRGPATYGGILSHNPDYDTSQFHNGTLTALRTKSFKYQRGENTDDLFKLPNEEDDVQEDHPETYERLRDSLDEWLAAHGEPLTKGEQTEFTDAVQRQLEDLGYME